MIFGNNTCLKISNRKHTSDHKENSHKLWANDAYIYFYTIILQSLVFQEILDLEKRFDPGQRI